MTTAQRNGSKHPIAAVFLVLFIDLLGFTIVFPLFPAMLGYYLPADGSRGGLLGWLVDTLQSLAASGSADPHFMAAVLFGGILGSLYAALQFIFAPILGRWSDRVGRRRVLLFTVAGNCLAYLLWVFSGSFAMLVLSRIIAGAMGGNLSVATAAVADITTERDRAKGMAVVGIAFGLGFLIGPAIGGIASLATLPHPSAPESALALNPFSVPALVAFALSLLNLLWICTKLPETLPEGRSAPERRLRPTRLFAIENEDIRRSCVLNFLFLVGFSGMEFTLTFLAVERFSYRSFDNGMMFLYIAVILVLVQGGIVRRFAHRVGEKALLSCGLAAGTCSLLLIGMSDGRGLFYAGLTLLAVSAGLVNPCLTALLSRYAPQQQQGEMIGRFRSAGSLARIAGPLIAAWLFFKLGAHFAYALGGVFLLLPLFMSRKLRQPPAGKEAPAS